MKVPFTLHKTDRLAPVSAVLLLSENVADLLALCARIAGEVPEVAREWPALPPIHAVAGGFLVKLGLPISASFPAAIRLRSLAANLFLPADAKLVPTLLDDEAAGLVRKRGLIFLPGGRVLAFAPDRLLTADRLLTLPPLPSRPWRSLPARPPRPDRLREILLDLPDDSPASILESGGANIGVEPPRPADAGPAAKAAGRTAMGAGKGLMWLGNLLHWPGLAKLGAALAAGAMKYVPRLSEAVLGQQEAALRELLRRFREGNVEEALRHALPLTDSLGRGAQPVPSAHLPTHNLFYRLSDLLGSRGGPASVWLSPSDVHAELVRQYRKAAEAATARGDYRRAAFIYGRLLNDYRLAADVLSRGGLHHDAAILYLELLRDSRAAPRAFEAAGETDRALELYCQRGEHIEAGDLLRWMGEDEKAVHHYLRAADQFAAADNHLAAANLLFERTQRADLALRYLADGWARRPRGTALACLLRLTRWHAEQDGQRELLALVAQAEEFFVPPGNESGAGQFFNALAQLADRANLSALRDELRDRALRGLADKLRSHARRDVRPGTTVSALFGQSGVWKPALVSDAEFALKSALRKKEKISPVPKGDRFVRLRTHTGVVSAVCSAPLSGRVFLGFVDGTIAGFDPVYSSVTTYFTGPTTGLVVSLATDDRGRRLIALSKDSAQNTDLISLIWSGTDFRIHQRRAGPRTGSTWLTPIAEQEGRGVVGLWEGDSLALLWSNDLLPWGRNEVGKLDAAARTALLFLTHDDLTGMAVPRTSGCLFCGDVAWHFESVGRNEGKLLHFGWRPGSQLRGLCSAPPLSRLWRDREHLELAGVDEDDSIHWTELDYSHPEGVVLGGGASNAEWKYIAAALIRPGLLAGVTREGIVWLRRDGHRLQSGGMMTLVPLENAVACAVSLPARELLVICREGVVVRVPLPN
jgi:tetratricopeptide (TPR) repeat protein